MNQREIINNLKKIDNMKFEYAHLQRLIKKCEDDSKYNSEKANQLNLL